MAVLLSPIPAALLTLDFVVVRANEAWGELLRKDASAFAGKHLRDAVRGDERTALQVLLDKFPDTGQSTLRLYVHLALSREEIRRALLIVHRAGPGRRSRLLAYIIDTSESDVDAGQRVRLLDAIEQAAWEWRRTFDAVESPILIVHDDLTVGRINRSARMLVGKDYGEIVGRPVGEIGDWEPWRSIADLTPLVQKTRAPAARQVKDGLGRTLDLLAMLFNSDDPNDGRVIIVVWDVTALVDLQTRFEQQRSMATIGALVAGVAHEVRNPLFGISATLDAMEQAATPELSEYFEVLRHEIDRMTELMRDLLAYGRPATPNVSEFEAGEIVLAAIRACTPLAAHSGVLLVKRVIDDVQLRGDRDRLIRALQNLIENAIQHSAPASAVTVECAVGSGRLSRQLVMRVLDEGAGFKEEDLPRIFEPFFSKRKGGTGLGLALVQNIVAEFAGEVTAANRPEGGGEVAIRLPLASGKA